MMPIPSSSLCQVWVCNPDLVLGTISACICSWVTEAKIEFLGKHRIIEGIAGLSMALSLKELMHLVHIQVTGEILAAWCSSLAIMAGPAGERLYVLNNELPSCMLLTVSCTTSSLWASLSSLSVILSHPGHTAFADACESKLFRLSYTLEPV